MEGQLEFTICDICEYYDKCEEVCMDFDCNGLDCPELPCEEGEFND